jgi:hypothetical protein
MLHTGRPIVLTSLILVIGFMALTAGSFAPSIYFGLVMSVIVVLALVADLLLTPSILCLVALGGGEQRPQGTEGTEGTEGTK